MHSDQCESVPGKRHQLDGELFDVVGVGLGPSNLALAVAIAEQNESGTRDGIRSVFLEQNPTFEWHPGMLLDGAKMQISFLKDLATLRNPMSPYSFINYLHREDRLVDFINHGTFFPSRIEFAQYLKWLAYEMDPQILYSQRVTQVAQAGAHECDGVRFVVRAATSDGVKTYRARSVVVATGIQESLPSWATKEDLISSGLVFHNHDLLKRLEAIQDRSHDRILVVGAGQSAAEVIQHLHRQFDTSTIESVINGYGLTQTDESPFANQIFDPSAIDEFFHSPPGTKSELFVRHRNSNYSCVEIDLLRELYAVWYRERVVGRERLIFRRATAVKCVDLDGCGVRVTLNSLLTGDESSHSYDAVVCATGLVPRDSVAELCSWLANAKAISVSRDYVVQSEGTDIHGLYVQGAAEETHGLSSTLLSNISIRSRDILDSIMRSLLP